MLTSQQQAAKISALQNAYRRKEAASPRDDAPSAGQIRSLGLLQEKEEVKSVDTKGILPTAKVN